MNNYKNLIKTKMYVDKGPLEPQGTKQKETNNSTEDKHATSSMSEFFKQANDAVDNIDSSNEAELSNEVFVCSNNTSIKKTKQEQAIDILRGEFSLHISESIIEFEECLLRIDESDYPANCILTDFRLGVRMISVNNHVKYPEDYFDFPIYFISRIDKIVEKKNIGKFMLEILSKDNRVLKLIFNADNKKLYASLCLQSNMNNYLNYAFKYREYHPCNMDGWSLYDPLKEFQRQGVSFDDSSPLRLSFVNQHYQMIPTYPEILVCPNSISDNDLREGMSFRTKSRIPVLSYFNKKRNSSLWRSSQTKSGLTYQRSAYDEKILKAIAELSTSPNKLIIYDARPYYNAQANRLKGAGFENVDNYHRCEICFCEIDNIHAVRNSHMKLSSLCSNQKFTENRKFLSSLEQTGWNEFIYLIIKAAVNIANSLKKGYSILVHCSDGWDRSSQLTSLGLLLADPYYRTISGFMILIEKEWLSYGHQFALRNGMYNLKDHSEDEKSPIFLQWLDCVHQFLVQFPHLFEFNMELLLFIAFHINTNKYGTFLFNSDKERHDRKAKMKTVSIWTDVCENLSRYVNPYYDKESDYSLILNFPFYKIRFWEELYLKYNLINEQYGRYYKKYKNNDINEAITNLNFTEKIKLLDNSSLAKKEEKINKLNNIIKEISSKIMFRVSDFTQLSKEAKEFISSISNADFEEEEGYIVVRSSLYK